MSAAVDAWALFHNIGPAAMATLWQVLAAESMPVEWGSPAAMSETGVQDRIRLGSARIGRPFWRNNVGAERGGSLRWGLANDSANVNATTKSADLIGITPVRIQPHHLGRLFGLFTSCEVKKGAWRYAGTPHEVAQLHWAEIVAAHGGIATFARSFDELQIATERAIG